MSRNLAQTCCDYCKQEPVALEEFPRPITPEEAGPYFDEFKGLLVANASCPLCGAKYLAWCDETTRQRPWRHWRSPGELGYFDLSFRSTFNDEPGPEDKPRYRVTKHVTYTLDPWTGDEWGK